jgi:hypothetical protein
MSRLRRIATPALAVALVAGIGLVSAPAPAAANEVIYVNAYPEFRIFAGEIRMTEDEFLEIAPFSGQGGAYTVRLFDYAQEGPGRPLLIGGAGCVPFALPAASVVCTFDVPPPSVRVDFLTATGPTNVAIMDEASLALNFRGSAGADYVQGGAGNDTIDGNGGNDSLFGGPGNDLIDGWAGDDYVDGEAGIDDMRGGSGSNSLDAADGIADVRVDCGGVPELLDFDEGLDRPTNCGANPTPIPPGPVEPIDPPAPGTGEGTIDGVPTTVQVTQDPANENQVTVTTGPNGPILNTGLLWIGRTANEPTFPLNSLFFPVDFTPLMPNTNVLMSIWSVGGSTTVPTAARSARTAPLESVEIRVNAQGIAKGNVPVPQGQEPGDFVMQINGVTASGGLMSINVGVVLAEKTPEPDPGPDESITITSASRAKGKKATTITVKGTAIGLDGMAVTPRYRVDGAKKWVSAKPVTVSGTGTFTWRLKTPKKVRIQVVSGAIRSPGVVVAAVKR